MLITTHKSAAFDRRNDNRRLLLEKALYQLPRGQSRRAELINHSRGGARLTTFRDVSVGQRFTVLHATRCGLTLRTEVEARWLKPLPGNIRQVVGVQLVAG